MAHICGNINSQFSKLAHYNKDILWQASFLDKVPKIGTDLGCTVAYGQSISLILHFLIMIVHQYINAGLTKCVVSYRIRQKWISRIMTSSICSLRFKLFTSTRIVCCWYPYTELSLLKKKADTASNKTNLLNCFHIISWTCHTGLDRISLENHCLALAYQLQPSPVLL